MKRFYATVLIISLGIFLSMPASEAKEKSPSDSLRTHSSSVSGLQLKGTMFTRSLKPLAIIEDTATGRSAIYEQGDAVNGAEIIYIARGEVVFKTLEGEYRLSLPSGGLLQAQTPLIDTGRWYNVKREGDTFIVDKATISGAINRAPDIMKNVRVKPCFIDGKASGIMVTKLTPIGILKEIGVKESDVIRSVNGLTLNTPHQIFTAYQNLKDKKEVRVELMRSNKPQLLTYKVSDAS